MRLKDTLPKERNGMKVRSPRVISTLVLVADKEYGIIDGMMRGALGLLVLGG